MKTGVMVPQVTGDDFEPVARTLAAAQQHGLDGVFVFDHLWSPDRRDTRDHALSAIPTVAALAARRDDIDVGTLVARVGIVSDELMVRQLATINAIANGRFIAGLGVGDAFSRDENAAYGVTFASLGERLECLDRLVSRLMVEGVTMWLGGRSQAIRHIAIAHAVPVNQWQADPDELQPGDTWGGVFDELTPIKGLKSHTAYSVFLLRGASTNPEGKVVQLSEAVGD